MDNTSTSEIIEYIKNNHQKSKGREFKNEVMNYMLSSLNTKNLDIRNKLSPSLEKTLEEELEEIRTRYKRAKKSKEETTFEDSSILSFKNKNPSLSPFIYSSSYRFFSEDYKYGILADIRDSSAYRIQNYENAFDSLYEKMKNISGENPVFKKKHKK